MHRSVVRIQATFRGYIQRKKYRAIRKACTAIQARWRGKVVRRKMWELEADRKLVIVQKYVRGYLARRNYKRTLRAIVVIQCWFRRYLAKKEWKRLKAESRSMNHLQNLNKGLENKIISLQRRVNELLEERERLKQELSSSSELREQVTRMVQLEKELAERKAIIDRYGESSSRHESQIEKLSAELVELNRLFIEEQTKNKELLTQLAQQRIAKGSITNGYHANEGSANGFVPSPRTSISTTKRGSSSLGMIQVTDLDRFVRILIYDFKPEAAAKLEPGAVAAFLIFMAIRYEDHVDQEFRIYEIFEAATKAIKDVIRERFDFDTCALWLSNTWRLYQLLKQYGGNKDYTKFSTASQLDHVIYNRTLDDFERQLEPLLSHLYIIMLTELLEPMISTKIVPAVLEHKETEKQQRAPQPKYRTLRMRAAPKQPVDAMHDLLDQLKFIHDKMAHLGLDFPVISQLFDELTSIITSSAFNRLMFRRDFCTHGAAIQIKHNVTLIQNWLRDHNLSSVALQPLMEACHLLQARKTEQDIDGFHEMCSSLNVGQISRLLTHYKSDAFEAQLLPGFVEKVDQHLRKRRGLGSEDSQPFLLSSSRSPALEFSFVPSPVSLENVQIAPAALKQACRKL